MLENLDAPLILADGQTALPLTLVTLHQPAMSFFIAIIFGQYFLAQLDHRRKIAFLPVVLVQTVNQAEYFFDKTKTPVKDRG